MAKWIVWKGVNQQTGLNVQTGIKFENGVPRMVTDEQAAALLAVGKDQYLQSAEQIETLRKVNPNFVPTANPLYGKPMNPEFELVEDPTATKVAPVAASSDYQKESA